MIEETISQASQSPTLIHSRNMLKSKEHVNIVTINEKLNLTMSQYESTMRYTQKRTDQKRFHSTHFD